MNNSNTINIHGKEYIPVASRVQMAHQSGKPLSIITEVLSHEPVLVKATVTTEKGIFTGISAANPKKSIEASSPFEVAETSAVGRALGFAGYGVVEGIATADEMMKAGAATNSVQTVNADPTKAWQQKPNENGSATAESAKPSENKLSGNGKPFSDNYCGLHRVVMKPRISARGKQYYDHRAKGHLVKGTIQRDVDDKGNWYWCQGTGYHLSMSGIR